MTDRELLQELIYRATKTQSVETLDQIVESLPANNAYAAMDFEPILDLWFDTECVANDVNVAWELREIAKARRAVQNETTKEVTTPENN